MEITNSIIQHSSSIINWCLNIIGGSILVIISSDYVRPLNKKIRLFYLLFIPGWCLLGYTIKLGINIANYEIMSTIMQKDKVQLLQITANMGFDYSRQLLFFNLGLACFGIWIVSFLISWIFGKN